MALYPLNADAPSALSPARPPFRSALGLFVRGTGIWYNPDAMGEKGQKTVIVNRRARHEYFIEETREAGICLSGTEVKSIRLGKASIQEAFARVENGEIWLHNMYIAPYEQGTRYNLDPRRPRKLLLHRIEIEHLAAKAQQKGLALIPLRVFFERGYAKVELGVGRGKKLYDKREAIAERDAQREERRALAERRASE